MKGKLQIGKTFIIHSQCTRCLDQSQTHRFSYERKTMDKTPYKLPPSLSCPVKTPVHLQIHIHIHTLTHVFIKARGSSLLRALCFLLSQDLEKKHCVPSTITTGSSHSPDPHLPSR